jgi:hypothetical protein
MSRIKTASKSFTGHKTTTCNVSRRKIVEVIIEELTVEVVTTVLRNQLRLRADAYPCPWRQYPPIQTDLASLKS